MYIPEMECRRRSVMKNAEKVCDLDVVFATARSGTTLVPGSDDAQSVPQIDFGASLKVRDVAVGEVRVM